MNFYKVLIIGDVAVGKTSLVNRVIYNTFEEKYKATIGCEFGLKMMLFDDYEVRIQLWDLAGQDHLGGISRLYCRDSHGAIVVTDATKAENIQRAIEWKTMVDDQTRLPDGRKIPMVLCLNKTDLVEDSKKLSDDELQSLANQKGFISIHYTSNKTGENVSLALDTLIKELISYKLVNVSSSVESRVIKIANDVSSRASNKNKKCC